MYIHVHSLVCIYITFSTELCDDGQLEPIHIILTVAGVVIHIIGMCAAVYLGVLLLLKASNCHDCLKCCEPFGQLNDFNKPESM